MPERRHLIAIAALVLFVIAIVWLLSTGYPTLWCSILGTCNA
jgi:hypothetical protein